jgi:ADP-ribose pyrophosphatase YjhB (NUDIX family)
MEPEGGMSRTEKSDEPDVTPEKASPTGPPGARDEADNRPQRAEDGREAEIEGLPVWLSWAREIQALAQTGLHFNPENFDTLRYARLQAIAVEMMAKCSGLAADVFTRAFELQEGYATPKVDVRAAVFTNGRVLMVRERSDGCWSLPGGYADINERPSAMVAREVREESGYIVRARRLVGVYESNHDRAPLTVFHAYKLVFLCDLLGGEAAGSNETTEVGFFALEDLPPLSPHRTQRRHIEEALAHLRDPHRPAAFD